MIIIEQAPGKLNVQLHFIIWQIIAHLYFYTLRSARASSFTVNICNYIELSVFISLTTWTSGNSTKEWMERD